MCVLKDRKSHYSLYFNYLQNPLEPIRIEEVSSEQGPIHETDVVTGSENSRRAESTFRNRVVRIPNSRWIAMGSLFVAGYRKSIFHQFRIGECDGKTALGPGMLKVFVDGKEATVNISLSQTVPRRVRCSPSGRYCSHVAPHDRPFCRSPLSKKLSHPRALHQRLIDGIYL